MNLHAMRLTLAVALATALFATACDRDTGPVDNSDTDTVPSDQTTGVADPTTAPSGPSTVSAPAPIAAPAEEMPFASLDLNGDGALGKDELGETEMLHQHFEQADSDGNGALSPAEVDAHRAAMAAGG